MRHWYAPYLFLRSYHHNYKYLHINWIADWYIKNLSKVECGNKAKQKIGEESSAITKNGLAFRFNPCHAEFILGNIWRYISYHFSTLRWYSSSNRSSSKARSRISHVSSISCVLVTWWQKPEHQRNIPWQSGQLKVELNDGENGYGKCNFVRVTCHSKCSIFRF